MVDRKLLRRVAAILYHRRAGFSANGMGVWRVPEEEILETGRPDGRVPRDLPLLPAPDLSRLALQRLHDGPRPLEGGVRRDPRLDRRGVRDRTATTAPPSTPRPSTRRSACTTSPTTTRAGRRSTAEAWRALALHRATRTELLPSRARPQVLPGGVNSPVRAMRQIGRDPIFIERGEGCELVDVDGNRYVDWVCSWGPLILGHAHPAVVAAVARGRRARHQLRRRRPRPRSSWPRRSPSGVPSVEMVRMTSSGTEAAMSAVRLARAATGREVVVKFAGAYHGHSDGLLAEAGSGMATLGVPASPGVTAAQAAATVVVPWNDRDAVERGAGRARGRGAAGRADRRQHGRRPARPRASSSSCARRPRERGRAARLRRGDHRLPRRPRRRPGALRGRARPDRARQGARRRPAGGRLRRPARADGADRPGRRRLPGGHALGQPARGRRRPGDPARSSTPAPTRGSAS